MDNTERDLRETTVRFYVGERDGMRITVFVPGRIDPSGGERIAAAEARKVEAVLRGGDFRQLPHLAEPVGSSRVDSGAPRSHAGSPAFVIGHAAS